jgi:hypothetical protein
MTIRRRRCGLVADAHIPIVLEARREITGK